MNTSITIMISMSYCDTTVVSDELTGKCESEIFKAASRLNFSILCVSRIKEAIMARYMVSKGT